MSFLSSLQAFWKGHFAKQTCKRRYFKILFLSRICDSLRFLRKVICSEFLKLPFKLNPASVSRQKIFCSNSPFLLKIPVDIKIPAK
jgi:hypothetical protein